LEKRRRDIREAMRQTLDLVAARARQQGVRLECELPERPVVVEADHEQLRQLLLNLVLNALDAQMQGGAVRIGVEEVHAETAQAAAPDGPPPWIVLTVADQGPGVAAGMSERIFDPYVSTKETGLGLGLAICRRIVEDHGGEIDVKNGPKGGAVFVVRLPAFAANPA
jgi:C4-dicarboxylate-specific signal transduction histidine kinase